VCSYFFKRILSFDKEYFDSEVNLLFGKLDKLEKWAKMETSSLLISMLFSGFHRRQK
jgi:hypothetical protein